MPYSTTFNAQCYVANYPDVKQNKYIFKLVDGSFAVSNSKHSGREEYNIQSDPYKHYDKIGRSQGRVPGCLLNGSIFSPEFNGTAYLARYPDVARSEWKSNPLGHWNGSGQAEGRIPGFELVTPQQLSDAKGFSTPGTTLLINVPSNPVNSQTPAIPGTTDVNQLQSDFLESNPNQRLDNSGTNTATTTSSTTGNFLTSNPLILVAGAGLLFLILKKKKKTKK